MPNLGVIASSLSGHLVPPYDGPYGAYDSLATVTLSASTASITFAGIPSGYKHLQIRVFASPTTADVFMRFNGDGTTTNYSRHYLYGDGGGGAAAEGGVYNDPNLSVGYYSTTSGIFGASVVDVLDYASTSKNKVIRALSGGDANGSGLMVLYSGSRNLTNAITSITIFPTGAGDFREHSSFALYGVR
jgi:hypothetical protein